MGAKLDYSIRLDLPKDESSHEKENLVLFGSQHPLSSIRSYQNTESLPSTYYRHQRLLTRAGTI